MGFSFLQFLVIMFGKINLPFSLNKASNILLRGSRDNLTLLRHCHWQLLLTNYCIYQSILVNYYWSNKVSLWLLQVGGSAVQPTNVVVCSTETEQTTWFLCPYRIEVYTLCSCQVNISLKCLLNSLSRCLWTTERKMVIHQRSNLEWQCLT